MDMRVRFQSVQREWITGTFEIRSPYGIQTVTLAGGVKPPGRFIGGGAMSGGLG
jgi:hypothetical protein